MEHQLVVFELAQEDFGVEITNVERIIKLQKVSAIPNAPSFVEGVINLRGRVIPVIDLRRRFGLPKPASERDSRIIVISSGDDQIGMIVDAVSEVLPISDEDIDPPSPIVTTVASRFITGIGKVQGDKTRGGDSSSHLIILIDLHEILSAAEREALKDLPDAA